MPDLDEMFRIDAENDAVSAVPALGASMSRARATTRRRHSLLAGGAACVALAACSGLLYAGTSGGAQEGQVKLAAYDRVIGPDHAHPGRTLVFGPDDEHVANCTKLPESDVTMFHLVVKGPKGDRPAIGFGIKGHPGQYAAEVVPVSHPPYYFFSCPSE